MKIKPIIDLVPGLIFLTFLSLSCLPGWPARATGQQATGQQAAGQQATNLPAVNQQTEKDQTVTIETISNKASYELIKANAQNPDFLLIDVRTAREFNEKHIAGALNIDFYAAEYKEKLKELGRSKKILLYCRSGNRSGKTLPLMQELGFSEVYNMDGGLIEWEAQNYPLVKP